MVSKEARMVPDRISGGHQQKLLASPTTTTTTSKFTCSEILSGSLTMLGGASDSSSLRVCVKVYRTSLEHFAVVYPDKLVCNPIGYVNLKNCSVECERFSGGSTIFHVVRKSCDGSVLTFRTESSCDVRRWIEALHDGSTTTTTAAAAASTTTPIASWYRRKLDECQIKVSLPILVEEGDEE